MSQKPQQQLPEASQTCPRNAPQTSQIPPNTSKQFPKHVPKPFPNMSPECSPKLLKSSPPHSGNVPQMSPNFHQISPKIGGEAPSETSKGLEKILLGKSQMDCPSLRRTASTLRADVALITAEPKKVLSVSMMTWFLYESYCDMVR